MIYSRYFLNAMSSLALAMAFVAVSPCIAAVQEPPAEGSPADKAPEQPQSPAPETGNSPPGEAVPDMTPESTPQEPQADAGAEGKQPESEGAPAAPAPGPASDPAAGPSDTASPAASEAPASADPSTSSSRRRRRSDFTRSSEGFVKQFEPIVDDTRKATVEVQSGGKTVSMGIIVDPAGFILTKQSELKNPITCLLHDGTSLAVSGVYGIHTETDLALLKINPPENTTLPTVRWSSPRTLDVGEWLISVRGEEESVVVGIVGVRERKIRAKSGFMGVNLGQADNQVTITRVEDDTPADRAGLRQDDLILAVNGTPVTDIPGVQEIVRSFPPGHEITLKVRRADKEFEIQIILGDAEDLNPMFERSNQQNTMGGNELSRRRQDFPLAVQHDGFVKPRDCGGPVVNIDGEVVGINIARQGRVASLMLPVSVVLPVIADLKSGQRAPALVNKSRIDEINSILQGLRATIGLSPANDESATNELKGLQDDEDKARKDLDEAMGKLDKAREARLRAEIAMQSANSDVESAQKRIEQLEKELQELVSGSR